MKHITKLALLALSVMAVACSKDSSEYESYCPTWKGFTCTVNGKPVNSRFPTFVPGDQLQITACQDKLGHLINSTDYTWTLCYDTLDAKTGERVHAQMQAPAQHTNYDGYVTGSADPLWRFQLPENTLDTEFGRYDTIKFVARYSYSGYGVTVETGSIIENTGSYYAGRITPQSGPTGGGATGYYYFNVVK